MKTILLFITSLLFFHSSHAQVDPSIDWKVLEEEHATWIYDSRHKNLVSQYSKHFKRLFPQLKEMFQEVPDKTTFVISDHTDMPNGSATVFPYPMVIIYPVIPVPASPIGESNDSFYDILVHEYTHILNLAPVHGFPKALSWIFGSIVRPNAYLPRWYAEGLAVFTESYFNPKGGRLRSQNFEGLMRAMGRDKVWDDYKIDQLNDFQPDWMGGRRAYLLGGALMHDIAIEHGVESVRILNQRYSRRIPYFLTAPVEDQTGLDYKGLLSETYTNMQVKVDEQLRTIQSAPVTQGQSLPQQGNQNRLPRFSPNGQHLAYLTRNHNVPSAIHLVTRAKGEISTTAPEQIAFGTEIEHLAWSTDSQKLAYNNTETYKRFYIYSDIYIYDVKKKTTERLTKGARVGDLTFAKDNQWIVFVQNTPGSKQISKIDLKSKAIIPIYKPGRLGANLFALSAQDNDVYFLEQSNETRLLKKIDLTTFDVQVLRDNLLATQIRKTPKGFLVTSSHSGVDNLYLIPELAVDSNIHAARPITNSTTRIFDGDIDPISSALYFSEQQSSGVYISAQAESDWKNIATAPKVAPLMKLPPPQEITTTTGEVTAQAQEKDFSPLPYMWPRYWMPFGYAIDGGVGFQASTGSSDPLGKNAYSLLAEWDTLTEKVGGSFGYVNTSTPVQLGVDASQVYRYFYASQLTVKDTSYGAEANFNIPFMWRSWNAGVAWRQSTTDFVNFQYERGGPQVHLSYNSAVRRGYQISPDSGTGFSLMHQAYLSSIGNVAYDKTNLNFRKFFPSFFENHALMFQVNGTYAPELWNKSLIFHTSSIGGNFVSNQLVQPFLIRGYPSGNLIGYNMGAATLEYRFPIFNVFKGVGTFPFFVRQIHGAFVGDVAGLDGIVFNAPANGFRRSEFGKEWFGGYGAEVNIESTVGYYLPLTLTFGVYHGDNLSVAENDLSYFFMFRF